MILDSGIFRRMRIPIIYDTHMHRLTKNLKYRKYKISHQIQISKINLSNISFLIILDFQFFYK